MNKTCTICHTIKPLTDYTKDRRQRLGRRPECKRCEHQRPSYLLKSLRFRLSYPKYQRWYKGITSNLTTDDITALSKHCHFCTKLIDDGASLHRLDHTKDYTAENVVLVHKSCHAVFGTHNKGPRIRG